MVMSRIELEISDFTFIIDFLRNKIEEMIMPEINAMNNDYGQGSGSQQWQTGKVWHSGNNINSGNENSYTSTTTFFLSYYLAFIYLLSVST